MPRVQQAAINKDEADYRCHNLPRCSEMLKDDRKPATDQQMDQWINGSTDLWINGSTMKVNAPKTEMKKRKLLRILRKVPAWRML